MVLMNLPGSERFKPENVFLVGVIPGPLEPKHNINSYLQPLVAQLNALWRDGISVKRHGSTKLRNSTLLCFVLAVTSQQQKRFVDLLSMAQIRAAQSAKKGQLVLKLIFQDLNRVLQGATRNISR